jgi:AraC family transcriptional activator of pobA
MNRSRNEPLKRFLRLASRLQFEEYDGRGSADVRGRFQWRPPSDFPMVIKPFSFSARKQDRPLTWHEYLELFIPLEGRCRLQIGHNIVELAAGDLLVMDNMKLHAVRDFTRPRGRAIVVRFLPDLIYSTGSFLVDHLLCLPFYHQVEGQPYVVRGTEAATGHLYTALGRMLECSLDPAASPCSQAGVKVFFLEVLYHLAQRFQVSGNLYSEYLRRRDLSHRLQKLFDYTTLHYAEKITLSQAAALVAMSRRRFLDLFKRMAETTWVAYLNDVRLTNAAQLLKQTELPIVEVANRVGYSDQSYLNRRFKQRFGESPLQFRRRTPQQQ